MLEIKGLCTDIRTRDLHVKAVRSLSLTARDGIVTGIVGESGSGKSIAMKSVLGILPPGGRIVSGSISWDGRRIDGLPEKGMRRIRGSLLAMIFQDPMTALNPVKTVGGHLIDCIRRHQNLSKSEAAGNALKALESVGISSPRERMKQYPHEFSGGMLQRIMIAMALSLRPKLLIADEPTTALDVTTQAQILDLIQDIRKENGMSVILITHDLGVVARLCDRVVVMYGGMALEEGSVEDIFYRPLSPYTRALLMALPRMDGESKSKLRAIKGSPPNALSGNAIEDGICPFHPRCDEATEHCGKTLPTSWHDGHSVRCHLYGGQSHGK